MYASGLTWEHSYHNKGARITILCTMHCYTVSARSQGHAEVVRIPCKCIHYSIRCKKLVSWNSNGANLESELFYIYSDTK